MTVPIVLLAIPLLSTTFGFVGGYKFDEQLELGAFGLVWGVVAMLLAPRLARRGARSTGWANTPVHIMVPLAFVVLGGSIIGHLAGPTPTTFLRLLEQPGYGIFFYSIHGPFEWVLMPWALIVNWHHPARRRLLVVAAVIFYLGRLASALYFAPNAIHWGANPAEAAGQFDELALWIRLDLIRVILQDALVAVALLVAALHHKMQVVRSTRVRQDPVRRTGGAAIPR